MIKKLKIKFIILSVISIFILLAVIVAGMNLINYTSVVRDADEILYLLSQNRGTFPGFGADVEELPSGPNMGAVNRLPHHMSPELPYESRYFSVLVSGDGSVIYTDTSKIASVDAETAVEFAREALLHSEKSGFADQFRFVRSSEGELTRITFLDCGRKLESFYSFLFTSIMIAVAGFAGVFFVLVFFAGRILRPISESYEKQKRFITDAGHEIKTPLTVINANVDILEMELGHNESLADISQQTKRLTALTNDLVCLARMEESEKSLQKIDFPISEIVQEEAEQFKLPAQAEKKLLEINVQPLLTINGNDRAIGQLVSILMDNALKYSPAGGKIELTLSGQSRSVVLTVCNSTDMPVDPATLNRVFDRFYRTDPSRNSSTGGHGIGLSIARAIVTAHGGKITASSEDGRTFRITAVLPL